MQTFVVLACVVLTATAQSCSYSSLCNDHTMCIYSGTGDNYEDVRYQGVTSSTDKQNILDMHNQLRSKVAKGQETRGTNGTQPPASNMNKLEWDDELAEIAQRWADQCDFAHDSCRNIERFRVGQNVYESWSTGSAETGTQDWERATLSWYNEVSQFNKDDISPFQFSSATGHYTQTIWATTKYIGCGFTAYKKSDGWYHKYYVCNYGPGGNYIGATMYKTGNACTACTNACDSDLRLCL